MLWQGVLLVHILVGGSHGHDVEESLLLQRRTSQQPSEASECMLPEGAAWAEVRLPGQEPYKMAVYAEQDIVSQSLLLNHNWENGDPALYGTPGHAYDIGGNIGFYSLMLAKAGWNVTAFEPLPANVAMFRASLCVNQDIADQIDLRTIGLSDAPGSCTVWSDPKNVGDGILRCDGSSGVGKDYELRGHFDVKVLDNEMQTSKFAEQNVDLVKIDVEGFECHVFRGASKLLAQRPRMIQSEVWANMADCTPTEYFKLFQPAGYKVMTDIQCLRNASIPVKVQAYDNFWMCKDTPSTKLAALQIRADSPKPKAVVFMVLDGL